MRTPYLIQRLNFRKNSPSNGSFDDIIGCQYMGSAEFEFGALPKSLKKLTKNFGSLKINTFEDLHDHKDKPLCIVAEVEKAELYFSDYINDLALDNTMLKEQSRFKDNVFGEDWRGKPVNENDWTYVDAWWDVENDIIFTFGKMNGEKVLTAIRNTRDKKRSEGVEGWY